MDAPVTTRLTPPPSMAALATEALRAMILRGELAPGERLVESRLTERLGVSRPPVREALKDLQHEGLVAQHSRRGVVVRELTQHDVLEIVTLRADLEQLALRLALPVRDTSRLAALHDRLADLEAATDDDELVERGFAFHLALVALAGHERVVGTYRGLQSQLQLCMRLNVSARAPLEDAAGNAARHRVLLDAVATGDVDVALAALRDHGHDTFLPELLDRLPGATADSAAWRARV